MASHSAIITQKRMCLPKELSASLSLLQKQQKRSSTVSNPAASDGRIPECFPRTVKGQGQYKGHTLISTKVEVASEDIGNLIKLGDGFVEYRDEQYDMIHRISIKEKERTNILRRLTAARRNKKEEIQRQRARDEKKREGQALISENTEKLVDAYEVLGRNVKKLQAGVKEQDACFDSGVDEEEDEECCGSGKRMRRIYTREQLQRKLKWMKRKVEKLERKLEKKRKRTRK